MDTSRSLKPKKQKLNEEPDVDGCSKNIADLPDSILHHILSFLPTKYAVRTCILSKKWQYLWTSVSNLDFEEGGLDKRKLFTNFVERVLVLHGLSCIKSFSLSCSVLDDAPRVNAWISSAVRHNVRKLSIYLCNIKEAFILPHCLFTSQSLTELELQMPAYILKLPSYIQFSSLKILTLTNIVFSDDHSTQQLFSGPAFEKLTLEYCDWNNLKAVSITAPKLLHLTIWEADRHSSSNSDGCEVIIFGRSLKLFDYFGEFSNDYNLYNTVSVIEAHIYISSWNERLRQVAYRVIKLLRGLANVKDLRLCSGAVQVLTSAAELIEQLPMFNNLTNLKFDPGVIDCDCEALLKILQNSPYLKTLDFFEGVGLSCEKDDEIFDPVPACFLSHLEIINVRQFDGTWEEIYVIMNLLKTATVLGRMFISFSWRLAGSSNMRKKIHELLLHLPSKSGSCKLVST